MTVPNIQILLVLVSVCCAVWSLIRLSEERKAWRDDEEMMSKWLNERREKIDGLRSLLFSTETAHREIMAVGNKTFVKMKRQIANRDGQITKLKRQIANRDGQITKLKKALTK